MFEVMKLLLLVSGRMVEVGDEVVVENSGVMNRAVDVTIVLVTR